MKSVYPLIRGRTKFVQARKMLQDLGINADFSRALPTYPFDEHAVFKVQDAICRPTYRASSR